MQGLMHPTSVQVNPQSSQAAASTQGGMTGNMLQTDDKDEDIVF